MLIFSHRGLGFGKKENSIESYKEALVQGFSIEIDVQKTKDGKLVISHDTNLTRQLGINKNITEMEYHELKGLIPSFEEVLNYFKNYRENNQLLAIHIKNEMQNNIIDLTLKAIKEKELENECFIFDVTTLGANHAKYTNPNVKLGLSVGEKKFLSTIYLWNEIKDSLDINIIWWDEWNSGLYNQENMNKIKQINKPVYAISPELHKLHGHPKGNNLEDVKSAWRNLIDLQVNGICTDYPLELKEFLS